VALVLAAGAGAPLVGGGGGGGGGDARTARAAAVRVIVWSVAVGALFGAGLLALSGVLPGLFSDDALVRERAHEIWWILALTMPLNGAVFALDGILIGAGDTRFLMWGMLAAAAVYVPVALLALHEGWGIRGVWGGLAALILVRLLTCGMRFARGRWALTGAPA
jgi:Na+-driven multidrug efflux pump